MRDFNVGDVVRVRQWDDMMSEFGLNLDGDIDCAACFTIGMEYLCGKVFTISKMRPYIGDRGSKEMAYVVSGHDFGWTITTDMLELADAKYPEVSADGIEDLI